MKKQPEITEKTKQVFIKVFCELYQQKPIEKISIQEISNKAGYNRSTFYQYFHDIYEVLEHIENEVLEYVRQKSQEGANSIEDVLLFYEEKGDYLSALLGDYGSNRFAKQLKMSISNKVHGINLPAENYLTPYLEEFHLATSFSIFRFWHRREKDLSLEQLFDLISRLETGGLSSFLKEQK